MKLYTYYRSSSAFRVRIALNIKGIDYESVPVHLVKDGGQHQHADYLAKNPQGLVPLLETDQGEFISQSMAIMAYLDRVIAEPALVPSEPMAQARVNALTQTIVSDIQPLNNLRVLKYLTGDLGLSEEQKQQWYQHWIAKGFSALEAMLTNSSTTGDYCFGDTPTVADCVLIPQIYNAERFHCPMDDYPTLNRINTHCLAQTAFINALPENQADAQ